MARKTRKVRAYTEVGKRIAALGKRQQAISRVLGVSQQTVSKKLRGETAIMLSDFETLAKHYKVPMTYFFEEEPASPELAVALQRVRKKSGALRDAVVVLSGLSAENVQRVLEIAHAIAKSGAAAGPSSRKRAAEDAPRYGRK